MELFDAGKYRDMRVCVALSGGVDSVCLLHSFKEQAGKFGIALSALHVEHGIRGEESIRDMEFCRKLCEDWGVPLKIVRANVPALVKERKENLENVARSVRYEAFRSLLESGEADLVATAHHADDVAETILFRLARGTGVSGMKAIAEYGGIVRPLLSCTRAEILAYASEKNLPHVEDSTNGDENFTRNYIRKTVLPAFGKIHGNAAKHLVEFASLAAEEDAFLQTLAESKIVRLAGEERVPVDLPDVLFARACLACMRQYTRGDGYTRANLEEIARLKTLQSGKKASLPLSDEKGRAVYAFREGNEIVFAKEEQDEGGGSEEMPFVAAAGRYAFPSPFEVRELLQEGAENFVSFQKKLYVDLDAFPAGCTVRARREGDMITPYHAPRKTLKKFLTDRKISSRQAKRIPVIAKGNEVYVVVGVEIADSVQITTTTERKGVIA